MLTMMVLLTGFLLSDAEAGVVVGMNIGGVYVSVNPSSPYWVPPPRPGYVWVGGHWASPDVWIPGHWRPNYDRPGWVWVDGWWEGGRYVEGYWRESTRPGYVWAGGGWRNGVYAPGYWYAATPAVRTVRRRHRRRLRASV